MNINWMPEPPDTRERGVQGRRRDFVALLKERPGVWAQYRPGHPHPCNVAYHMMRDYPGTEAVSRTRPDKRYDIYVRWTGP